MAVASDDPRLTGAVQAAKEARAIAYAPYSGFRMGAAVVTDSDTIVRGVLVENVSLGLAMCAERVALFTSVADQSGRPRLLVLHAPTTDGALTWPCGACLQVARELAGPELLVVATDGRNQASARLGDLAPQLPHKKTRTSPSP